MEHTLNARPESSSAPTRSAVLGVFALLAALTLYGLWSYGIWDPWEVAVADAARKAGEGAASEGPFSLTLRLVGAGFGAFGTREWAGRLPLALCGLALLGVTYPWVRRFSDASSALYAVLILGTTPFFLLHSREMVGATPAMLASALVMLGASGLALSPVDEHAAGPRWPFAGALGLGVLLGFVTGGALLTIAPPLLAVSAVGLLLGASKPASDERLGRLVVAGAGALVLMFVVSTLLAHRASASVWTGAAPVDAPLSTHERSLAELFHAFAPWSAVLPVALGAMLRTGEDRARELPLRLVVVLWAAFAYGAQSVFLSSLGAAAFPAPAALAVAVALWVRDRERDPRPFWPELAVIVLLVALVIRDFALYPSSPTEGLGIDAKAPEVFNPKRTWSLTMGLFALAITAACAAQPEERRADVRAPYRAMRTLWEKGGGYRGWLGVLAALLVYLVVYGALAWIAPSTLHMSSLAMRVGRALLFVPLAVPLVIAGAQLAYAHAPRLAHERFLPVLLAGVVVGTYTSQSFMRELATHLSPRVVFDAYNRLAGADEPLAQFRVQGRAAAYYAKGHVEDVASVTALTDFLAVPQRRWAVVAADQLADSDVAYRRKTGKHLFVASMENAKLTLLANDAPKGARDLNPLTQYVLKTPPSTQHPVNIEFEEGFELVGYDLTLPRADSVGPGQSFTVTWVWRVKKNQTQPFQVFVHGDGPNERINGDHDPVDGKYPVRLWSEGDVVVDRQKIQVPATAPAGSYVLYVGLFHGDTRAKVIGTANDGGNRARVATIRVQ
jgi:4-amino-4-deoxy-L-arabinose transferase-like glycosyltransferase